ncbi:hypothetical protein ACFL5H_01975 [Candidatus Latescibacterota bacterium]
MNRLCMVLCLTFVLLGTESVLAQDETGPVKIRVRRIAFRAGNEYSLNIPELEFHVLLQRQFDAINSSITANYDYGRKDMGFGMSHALNIFLVNPGISVDDNLYFREVFSDSTGIWSRKQSISPFLIHEFNEKTALGMNFVFEREWAPKRREGADIVHFYDYVLKLVYIYNDINNAVVNKTVTMSAERSFRVLRGQYNYFLLSIDIQYERILNEYITYRNNMGFTGNLTPQRSPLFFIGGPNTLLGFEKDKFWGRRVFFSQNLFEWRPLPDFSFAVKNIPFRQLSFLTQIDIGQVRGAKHIVDLKLQNEDIKIGLGLGFGFNTDIPYMPDTPLYFIISSPSDDMLDLKLYAGFGGWLR